MIDEKPTTEQLQKQLQAEQKAIKELFAQDAGQILLRHWKKMRLHKMFDPDPYVMAYRAAIHDTLETLIDIAEGR